MKPTKVKTTCSFCGRSYIASCNHLPKWGYQRNTFCSEHCRKMFYSNSPNYIGFVDPEIRECRFCGSLINDTKQKKYCNYLCSDLEKRFKKFMQKDPSNDINYFYLLDNSMKLSQSRANLIQSKCPNIKDGDTSFKRLLNKAPLVIKRYNEFSMTRSDSCCNIFKEHHDKLSDDPERLSTEFIKSLSKCDCDLEI